MPWSGGSTVKWSPTRLKTRCGPPATLGCATAQKGVPFRGSKRAVVQRDCQPWYTVLYIQVIIAIILGVLVGHYFAATGVAFKPLGDGFIALIKMMIAPVIFCPIVHGIASMGDLKKVGRVGLRALLYFEVVSTVALVIGLVIGEVVRPGSGFNVDPATLDTKAVASYMARAKDEGIVAHLLAIIPSDSFFRALARGDILQVLLVS